MSHVSCLFHFKIKGAENILWEYRKVAAYELFAFCCFTALNHNEFSFFFDTDKQKKSSVESPYSQIPMKWSKLITSIKHKVIYCRSIHPLQVSVLLSAIGLARLHTAVFPHSFPWNCSCCIKLHKEHDWTDIFKSSHTFSIELAKSAPRQKLTP